MRLAALAAIAASLALSACVKCPPDDDRAACPVRPAVLAPAPDVRGPINAPLPVYPLRFVP